MIQFNLLPDVKLQYLKARRTQHMVISISAIVIIVSLALLISLLSTVYVFQKRTLSNLNNSISSSSNQVSNTPNLNKILTIQNQLNVLTSLHNSEPVASRLDGYLKQITPSAVTLSQLSINFTTNQLTITGNAPSSSVFDAYADTLKLTTYATSGSNSQQNAFTDVVLSNFSISTSGASFTITANFASTIFSSANSVKLTVPNVVSTRSVLDQPTDLFKSSGTSSIGGQ